MTLPELIVDLFVLVCMVLLYRSAKKFDRRQIDRQRRK